MASIYEIKRTVPPQNGEFPPPICLRNRNDTKRKELVVKLQDILKGRFICVSAYNRFYIHTYRQTDYRKCKNIVERLDIEYFTFTDRNKKLHNFVIKGLTRKMKADRVLELLQAVHGKRIKKCFRMEVEERMFVVVTDRAVTVKQLDAFSWPDSQQSVRIVRYNDRKELTQCYRCQIWGHATSNCHNTPKCLKCAMAHWTRECTRGETEPPQCANCLGKHTANYRQCPVYLAKLKAKNDNHYNRDKLIGKEPPVPRPKPVRKPRKVELSSKAVLQPEDKPEIKVAESAQSSSVRDMRKELEMLSRRLNEMTSTLTATVKAATLANRK